jgi:hypothetical protein
MPHATAAWLVDNSSLTFAQIAEFCGLHILEVQAIADDTAATKLTGRDPIAAGDLTQEEIDRGQADPAHRLVILKGPEQQRRTSGPRYTHLSKRVDKPDGIAWILKHHPEIRDSQIAKLIGTTKTTIQAIRERTHWNMANITAKDPVALGLCGQRELDALVAAAAKGKGEAAPPADPRLEDERAALVAELKAQREAAAAAVDSALAEAQGEPGLPTGWVLPNSVQR